MSTLELACGADSGYLAHSAAMIHSVLTHRGSLDVRVHYLHGPGLAGRDLARMATMIDQNGGEVVFHEVADERIQDLATYEGITRAMWYRIYLPELVPEADRMLYLDGDTLAVDSLEPLWATDLDDHLLAAVTNVFMKVPAMRARPAALGLPGLTSYFNSGVLLMNLDAMRRDGTTEKLRTFALENELMFPDQDALNAVMGHRRLPLHPRWNCMNSILTFDWASEVLDADQIEEARKRPGIRHFEGPASNKPWHRSCDFELRTLYFEHRRQTPWPRVRLEGPRPWRGKLGLRRRLKRPI